jgi:arginyl-tRNA synthetase
MIDSALDILNEQIAAAMAKVTGRQDSAAIVRPATDPKFGDYQANGVMALAKQLKTNPRKLAEQVVAQLDLGDLCEPPEIAGPGFINLRLKPPYVAEQLRQINADPTERLGIAAEPQPQTVVVDFSSPNVAKQMHVGHLRSTIIGDCISRLLEFLGHRLIRQNHIGDWGTPMGMVIYSLCTAGAKRLAEGVEGELRPWQEVLTEIRSGGVNLNDLEKAYKLIVSVEAEYPSLATNIRAVTNNLQKGDAGLRAIWEAAREITLRECSDIYRRLDVMLSQKDIRGESFYSNMLPSVVQELKEKGLAQESDGAVCVFPAGFKTKEGEPLPFIIQKSDGAYLYATTDLAALRYRVDVLRADKIIYVTDSRQNQHFQMLFQVAEMAGWDRRDGRKVELVHVPFGSVLGEDGKPLKTRSGENVKLKELLDEAVERARAVVEEKNPDLPPAQKAKIAAAVGVGAVKYADYSNNRTSDYVFSFSKMLAMDGNTAPYMQYAYARVKSIERKAESKGVSIPDELRDLGSLDLSEPTELDLGKHLVRYAEAIESAAADYRPNYLTSYLYELAQRFSAFYTECPVLDAPPAKRPTRLLLCDLTAKTIKHGLSQLLGIQVVEQM